MMTTTVQVRFPTHRVYLHHDEDTHKLFVFKYDNSACDYDVFTDYDQASDWMMIPLPILTYHVTVSGDDQE